MGKGSIGQTTVVRWSVTPVRHIFIHLLKLQRSRESSLKSGSAPSRNSEFALASIFAERFLEMNWILLILFVPLFVSPPVVESKHQRQYTVCEDETGGLLHYKEGRRQDRELCAKRLATAYFHDEVNQTGWAFLEVDVISPKTPHWLQGYAAGFCRG
uniref:Phospholipase B-like n=1 Tax=Caenorhabditis japonica TaxID=281687 RepID=A0A8R1E8L7_CAEJA